MKHEFETLDELQQKMNKEFICCNVRKMKDCDVERLFEREERVINSNNLRLRLVYFKTLNEVVSKLKEITNMEYDYRDEYGRWIKHKGETRCKLIKYNGKEYDRSLSFKDTISIREWFKEIAPTFDALMKRTKDRRTKAYYMIYFYEILSKYEREYKIIEIFTRYSNIGFTLSQEELIEMRDIYIEISETKTPIEDLNRDFGIKISLTK